MKYCQFCGTSVVDGANFCVSCGKRIVPIEQGELEAIQGDKKAKETEVHTRQFFDNSNCDRQIQQPTMRKTADVDAPNAGFAVLCFFFPIVGLILFLVWQHEYPLKAKSCGKGALISVIVGVAAVLLYIIFMVVVVAIFSHGLSHMLAVVPYL